MHDYAVIGYLADGITEEFSNQFVQWREVRVISRTSAYPFKDKDVDIREVGLRLNVDQALEGSFEKQGDRVRISDGYHLWSRAYDESAEDMMTVQEDIARSITQAVRNLGRTVPDTHSFESSIIAKRTISTCADAPSWRARPRIRRVMPKISSMSPSPKIRITAWPGTVWSKPNIRSCCKLPGS